jgi:hypothetical protein
VYSRYFQIWLGDRDESCECSGVDDDCMWDIGVRCFVWELIGRKGECSGRCILDD